MLTGKRVLLTGGTGFIGGHVYEELQKQNPSVVRVPTHRQFDLCSKEDVLKMYGLTSPDVVIHLAAAVGGIGANQANPGKYMYDNLLMGVNMLDAARQFSVERYVGIGTSCSYPEVCPNPVKEESLWQGYPNPTTAPYGIAKLTLLEMAKAYRKQYGLNAITLIPANVYGPGDSFDPGKSHVIPALITKAIQAKETGEELVVWGTGRATREFIYVYDCSRAIVTAASSYNEPDPINLGTGVETSIRQVAEAIKRSVGFTGTIKFDSSKPDGQLNRVFDVTKAAARLNFTATMSLEDGIKHTVDWYLRKHGEL